MIERYKTVGADSISALEPKMIHEPKKINEPKIVYKFQRAEMDSQRAEMDSQRAEMDSQRAEMDSAPTYKHNRQSLRLKHYDYSREGYYFITIVAQNREHLFGEIVDGVMGLSVAGEMVEELWHDIPHDFKHVKLHEFIIMPNHIHGIIEIIKPYDTDIKPVGAESISALNMNTKKIHEFQRVDMESTPTLNNMDIQRAEIDSAPTSNKCIYGKISTNINRRGRFHICPFISTPKEPHCSNKPSKTSMTYFLKTLGRTLSWTI